MKNKRVLFFGGIIAAFVIGGLLGYCIAYCPWFSKPTATNTEVGLYWKRYSFGGVTFRYPTDWIVSPDYYYTPAGAGGQVGVTLSPRNAKAGEDKIGVGGRQVICAMFSNDNIKCKEINSLAFYTASVDPDIINAYNQILSTVTTVQID